MGVNKEAYFSWIVAHRRSVTAIAAVVTVAAAVYSGRVPINYGMEQFFPSFGVERERYDEYKRHFAKEDAQFTIFWQDERPPGLAMFRDLERVADVFEDAGLIDVQWFGNTEVTETVELDGEPATHIYRLVEEAELSDAMIRVMLDRHRANDLFSGLLWNEDQSIFTVSGYLEPEFNRHERRTEIEEAVTEALETIDDAATRATLAGVPVFRSRIPKMLEVDQALFLGGGFLVFCGILFYFFRHLGHVMLCLTSVFPAYLCAVALLGLSGRSISILTSFIPIIVLVVGVSDAIHLLTRYRHNRSELGDNEEAIARTFSELTVACFYTSATTAIGFLSLVGTRIGIIMEFGFFTAVAILLTYVFSMTLLPALLGFSARLKFNDRGLRPGWIRATLRGALSLSGGRASWVVLSFAIISVVGLAMGSTLRVNTFILDDMGPESAPVQDLDWIEAHGFGVFQVNLFIRGEGDGVLHDPEMLAWMARFEDFTRNEPLVFKTLGLPDLMVELRRGIVGDEETGLPQSEEEAAQLLFLAEMNEQSRVEDVYLREAGVAQIVLSVRDEGSVLMLPLLERIEAFLTNDPPPFGTAAPTGTAQMAQTYQSSLVQTFGPSLLIALVLVFAAMVRMFRSFKLGLLGLVPNVFPLVVLMAAMKVLGVDLKPSTILVFSIAFGLAVDDTLHFLSKLRDHLAAKQSVRNAVEHTLRETGPPILMTSLAMAAGFSLLLMSQFQVLVLVGTMTAVSVAAAVFADLFALPSLIEVAFRRNGIGPSRT